MKSNPLSANSYQLAEFDIYLKFGLDLTWAL